MTLTIVTSLIVALSIICVTGGLLLTRRDKAVSNRLDTYLMGGTLDQPLTLKELELSQPFTERVLLPIVKRLSGAFLWMLPQNRLNALRLRLTMAGNPSGISPTDFVGVKGLVMLIVVGVAVLAGYASHTRLTLFNAVLLGLIGFCAFALPDFWLSRRITQRQQDLINTLPDALDLLVIANEAGLSFENAIQEITGKWDNQLSHEFERVLHDLGMGLARREALAGLSERTGVSDITSFVTAVNQAESMGVSIGRVLSTQAEELRVRRRQRAQERANQAPIKMMFPLVFLIFPAIFAVLLGPAVPQLLGTFNNLGGG